MIFDQMSPRPRAIVALLILVPAPSIGAAMMLWILPGAVGTAISGLCKLWLLLLPVLWLIYIDKSKLQKPTISSRGIVPGVVSGILIAITMIAAFYFMAIDWIDRSQVIEKAQQAKLNTRLNYCLLFTFLILLNSLLEEYVWRWFVFRKCEEIVPPVAAVILSALLFTIHHVISLSVWVPWYANLLGSLGVFLGGCIWSGLYLRYRSIWPGYVSHVCADVVIFIMGWELIFGQIN